MKKTLVLLVLLLVAILVGCTPTQLAEIPPIVRNNQVEYSLDGETWEPLFPTEEKDEAKHLSTSVVWLRKVKEAEGLQIFVVGVAFGNTFEGSIVTAEEEGFVKVEGEGSIIIRTGKSKEFYAEVALHPHAKK